MKIYLDTCSIQRPFDSKNQIRILLEAEAVLGILSYVERKRLTLLDSDVLRYEIENIPNKFRKLNAESILELATSYIPLNAAIKNPAKKIILHGLMPLDALHLASAEHFGADYFCTCDDRFLVKSRKIKLNVKVVTPIELVGVIEK